MTLKVQTLNNISPRGLDRLPCLSEFVAGPAADQQERTGRQENGGKCLHRQNRPHSPCSSGCW